ncbi:hypothetical protein BS47DRAFT_1341706 [Hydnum rufescens UP504]|uniref:Uncharacterized protein n=1 Tax=Hydnum rufescens UP504 TaxID=1448309 RepID=A0A9P6B177_9AGAM|nr:hypothetical protein BS47DRAFT_1341706 [Hydnum rufescens UP504]
MQKSQVPRPDVISDPVPNRVNSHQMNSAGASGPHGGTHSLDDYYETTTAKNTPPIPRTNWMSQPFSRICMSRERYGSSTAPLRMFAPQGNDRW